MFLGRDGVTTSDHVANPWVETSWPSSLSRSQAGFKHKQDHRWQLTHSSCCSCLSRTAVAHSGLSSIRAAECQCRLSASQSPKADGLQDGAHAFRHPPPSVAATAPGTASLGAGG